MKISTSLSILAILLAGSVLAPGCGDDDDGGASGDCGSIARTICGKLQECAPFSVTLQFGSVDRCELGLRLECEQSTSAPGVKASVAEFSACIDQTYSTCDAVLGGRRGLATPEACEPVPGELADGASCFSDAQCQSTSCSGSSNKCGVCQPLKRGKEGEPCDEQGCEDELTCNNKGVCFRPQGAGAPCADDDNECRSPLVCSDKKVCVERTRGQVGDPCEGNSMCDITSGIFCGTEGKCIQITLAKAGEACGFTQTSTVGCEGTATCDGTTCVANAPDGGECSEGQGGKQCTPPAECVSGKCALPTAPACK